MANNVSTQRPCPICLSEDRELLHQHTLTFGGEQSIFVCKDCGMVYADSERVDYERNSIYDQPGACGSGDTPADRKKFEQLAKTIQSFGLPLDARILDVGCAQGGLLVALRNLGFTDLSGMDTSKKCIEVVRSRGFKVPAELSGETFDLVVASHVLEHIAEPVPFLFVLCEYLSPAGQLYIEVPDALRYSTYGIPFLDFNSEHINHFGYVSLHRAVDQTGLEVFELGQKVIEAPNTSGSPPMKYPAMWVLACRKRYPRDYVSEAISRYIKQSETQLAALNVKFEQELEGFDECQFWGANSYFANLATLPVFKRVKIVAAVDRNPNLWGRSACGVTVTSPETIRPEIPIVIGSFIAVVSIRADIEKAGLKNKVVTVEGA